ncbi:3-methyladenine DNA glycosylase [Nakamurella sp. YIM 132087]|uniref:3-methyladenine DNA glycosylase n=1 Tax=Nakamurella alba TaxID=2665158 RepID=A0A7K1FK70_9ACTN|nr:3-methyladenine DNA glycosylase [Nakamurella alba]
MPADEWRAAESAHRRTADELTAGHRERAGRGERHPVEDFLFTYYSLRPAQLRRWHPGGRTVLLGADDRADWRFQRTVRTSSGIGVTVDVDAFLEARGPAVTFTLELLTATAAATPHFGCFGLHEWAMVYRQDEEQVRHSAWPLRLGARGTDEVVESHRIRCSHHDAYRFFTPEARPRNLLAPDAGNRPQLEQPGCLHASMDLYKWAYKLQPWVSSDLLLRCFRFARYIREIDMRASPYDLAPLGYAPIRIETTEGRAEYVAEQRVIAARGSELRAELISVLEQL